MMDANIWMLILPNCTGVTQKAVSRELILTESMLTDVQRRLFCHCLCIIRFSDQQYQISNQVHGICLAVRALRKTSLGHYPTTCTFQSNCNTNTKTRTLHTTPTFLKCANFSTSVTGPEKSDFWDCQLCESSSLVH